MGQYTQAVQQLYVAYFNRPADPVGLAFWEGVVAGQNGNTADVSNAFATSAEYTATYAGMDSAAIVNQVYVNLFGRSAEVDGLLYWAGKLASGALSLSNIVTAISAGAQGTDATAYSSKVSAATSFTAAIDTAAEVLGYSGTAANNAAKLYISSVTDAATLETAVAGLDATVTTVIDAGNAQNNVGKTYVATVGVDAFTGGKGNDTFTAYSSGTAETLSSFDNLDGGAGTDSLTVVSAHNAAFTAPTTAVVKNIEIATLTGDSTVAANTSGWTGLTSLTVGATGGSTITAAATTAVTVSDSGQAGGDITLNGGSNVTVSSTGATAGGDIMVGTTTAPAGEVTISRATTGAITAGSISVSGGTKISVTQTASNAVNTTQTNGTVAITGGTATTSVTVKAAAAATASATVAGVNVNSVAITDVNGASTKAGTITTVSVDGYSTLGISGNAVNSLTLANGTGNIIIDNSGLATPTNKTLALSVNGLTGGTLDDADIYTTLNITTTGANSKLANITTGAVTAMTVAGTKGLTLTSTAGLTALKTVTVTGSAGVTADLSAATVTAVDTSASTGASKVTIDGSKATFTGGAGVDTVTLTASTPTKAISLGAGDDSLTLGNSSTPTGALAGGTGTDTLTMTAALAATASGSNTFAGIVTGFERVVLTGSTNQTIDLDVLGKFNHVTTSGGNGLTLSNLPTGGTLVLNGAGTAYTIGNSAFTAGTSDTVNLTLTDGSGAGVSFASTGITASGVENFVITTADTQATPTGTFNDAVTLLGNSVKSITVAGNAGLTLTATSTALTNVDASGIALTDATPGFSWTSGALAAAAIVKGSATGTNTVDASAATGGAVTYTGGSGDDAFTATNGKGNTINVGNGTNSVTVSTGNNTITGGTGADTVTATTGNNTVSLGNGANSFTASSGNNTYTGGTGVDTISVGGGSNSLTLGTGADVVNITAAGANVNTYSTIVDPHAGVTISFVDRGTETFNATKVTLANTAVFQDYANAVIQQGGNASVNGAFGWFQFNGDTYLVESRHDGSGNNASFVNGTDMIIKLTGLIDLSVATQSGQALTLV